MWFVRGLNFASQTVFFGCGPTQTGCVGIGMRALELGAPVHDLSQGEAQWRQSRDNIPGPYRLWRYLICLVFPKTGFVTQPSAAGALIIG